MSEQTKTKRILLEAEIPVGMSPQDVEKGCVLSWCDRESFGVKVVDMHGFIRGSGGPVIEKTKGDPVIRAKVKNTALDQVLILPADEGLDVMPGIQRSYIIPAKRIPLPPDWKSAELEIRLVKAIGGRE